MIFITPGQGHAAIGLLPLRFDHPALQDLGAGRELIAGVDDGEGLGPFVIYPFRKLFWGG